MHRVEDPESELLDDYRHLTDAAARAWTESGAQHADAPHGILIVEGRNALDQLIASELTVRSVLVTPPRWERHRVELSALADSGTAVLVADRATLRAVTGFDVHRGILAAAARPTPRSVDDLLHGSGRLVVTESVTDNENIGGIFRVAAAFGYDGVLCDKASADPLYRRSIRVSSGWSLRIPSARSGDLPASLQQLRDLGIATIALTPSPDASPVDRLSDDGAFDGPHALVLGTEGDGLTDSALDICQHRCSIPMHEEVDSLNVATAFAVVAAFAAARRGWS